MAAMLTVMCGVSAFAGGKTESLNQRKPAIIDSDLVIQIADITENALFYPVEIDSLKMEVMAVKAPDGTIRTAFNACHLCYQSSPKHPVLGFYVQKGVELICICERRYTMDMVGVVKEGCHPKPVLPEWKTVTASTITISRDNLVKAKAMFEDLKGQWDGGSCCD